MTKKIMHAGNMSLLGGRLCLDFANTADWHGSDSPVELLNSIEDLLDWCCHVNIMSRDASIQYLDNRRFAPDKGLKVLETTIQLREAVYRIFFSIARGEEPPADDMGFFHQRLTNTVQLLYLDQEGDQYKWQLNLDQTRWDWFLHPIVYSAAELLTSPELHRVKACGDSDCGWLFLDTSRNQSRRWCNMKDCGNRAKAKRFYRKSKK